MEITKCEFCNSRIANCEVHNCVRIGNQYRQTSATLPQLSSGNLAEDIELITAEEMEYEARWPSMSQGNSSNQQSFLFDMHQQTDFEENAATEMYSRYDVSTHDQYNPANSDFHFPSKLSVEENEYTSVNLQQSSEPSKMIRSQNSQPSDATCFGHTANIPSLQAKEDILPSFQRTFGRRNVLKKRMAQHLKNSSQTEYSRMSRSNEVFYSTSNLIHTINTTEQIETFSFASLTCEGPIENLPFSTNNLCGNSEGNIFNSSETENPNNITDVISIPGTSDFTVDNQESSAINFDAMKSEVVENNPKYNKGTVGIADSVSCASNSNKIKWHDFGNGIINNTELYTYENSSSVSGPLVSRKACNISTRTTANESSANNKNRSEDKLLSKNLNSSKDLGTPFGNMKQLNKCGKDRTSILLTDHFDFPQHSRTVASPYKCKLCDKSYDNSCSLKRHVRTHTDGKPYKCADCSKCFAYRFQLRAHNKIHTGENSCRECGKCFSTNGELLVRFRIHTGEKPYSSTECGKCFAVRSNMLKHVCSIHTGETPCSCRECGKCFVYNSELEKHMRTHSGEKPYARDKCSKRYSKNFDFKHHMLRHAGEDISKYDSCGEEF
ncbi:hypothetical protein CDAR_46771 [Caerostris darwini]|uniref:C2H2-type domain-containing protein n=1 Tax=Caerostris darwini TaxID=1538125 RepID=A0AAV4SNF6_9ARAC|nr:hypothetical protein CDAR_46771 [Caerostris darwini]